MECKLESFKLIIDFFFNLKEIEHLTLKLSSSKISSTPFCNDFRILN